MKICAILNVWDGEELLPYAVDNWVKCGVHGIVVVWSEQSNYFEKKDFRLYLNHNIPIIYSRCEPEPAFVPSNNERKRRQTGLDIAKALEYTHFVTADVDEFYEPDKFKQELNRFKDPKLVGLVCASQVYFKSPSLTIGLDVTRVPFIHEIIPDLKYEFNQKYPFAWEAGKIRIDPTRSFNINCGVEWSDIVMHHYSYVRKDLEIKIRNSTARDNIERSTIREDYLAAKEGYFVKFYGKTLIRASVDFNIPEFVQDIQPLAAEGGETSGGS
jgi:hypothetical protein